MNPARFRYETLQAGCIRLLQIIPSSGDIIKCNLKHSNLRSNQSWFALSYVWGTSPADQSVLLNGQQFAITGNLLNALKTIANAHTKDNSIPDRPWIWIDAICINQNDLGEKSVQVPLMGELYSRARAVFVWLGEEHSPLVADVLSWLDCSIRLLSIQTNNGDGFWAAKLGVVDHRLQEKYKVVSSEMKALHSLYDHLVEAKRFASSVSIQGGFEDWIRGRDGPSSLFPPKHPFWRELAGTVNTRWYRRVWTYQEIHLATDAKLLLGDSVTDYVLIERLAWIAFQVHKGEEPTTEIDLRQSSSIVNSIAGLHTDRNDTGQALAIHLVMTQYREASEARDNVYGLLGMVREHVRSAIPVDYNLPPSAVFAQAMHVAVVESAKFLPYIWEAFSTDMTATMGKPTWCPDFRKSKLDSVAFGPSIATISNRVRDHYDEHAQISLEEPFPALGFSAWKIDRVLHARSKGTGISFLQYVNPANFAADVVVRVFRTIVELSKWFENFDQALLQSAIENNTDRLLKLLHFAVSLEHIVPEVPFDLTSQRTISWKILELCTLATSSQRESSFQTLQAIDQMKQADYPCFLTLVLTLKHLCRYVQEVAIVETESGKIGYSVSTVSEGDHIIYVPNGTTLHILSEDKQHYKGEARIDGWMEDELLDVLRDPRDSLETFYIT